MAENQYLVITDVPSIKKYVFGTDRLKEIRGASALLEELTRNRTIEYLNGCQQLDVEAVFVGGGAGQFLISAKFEDLSYHMRTLGEEFTKATCGGARLNWGAARYDLSNYQQTLLRAVRNARQRIEEQPFKPYSQLHTGFIRECDSCDGMVSTISLGYSDNDSMLCDVCRAKVDFNFEKARKNFIKELSGYLGKKGVHTDSPQDFEQIGEQCRTRRGYTALVYADGNSMGKFIRTIDRKDLFEFFSHTVDTSIREACFEALFEVCFQNAKSPPTTIPAEILMLGGDDLLVYLTADTAFPFALKVAEKFSTLTRRKMEASSKGKFFLELSEGKGLSISLGIAFGKSHTPFSILLEQSEELLASAKKAGSDSPEAEKFYTPTYIDYHFATSFNQIRVADCRINHLEIYRERGRKTIKLYRKPYSLIDAKDLWSSAYNLVQTGIPSTRLHRMGYAPSLGKMNGTLECLKLYTRMGAEDQRLAIWDALARFDCIRNMPWNEGDLEDTTVLVDLMELIGFCGSDNIKFGEESDVP